MPDALPQSVAAHGCFDCPAWGRIGVAVGHCWLGDDPENRFGVARAGQLTCSSHICAAHPKFEARS